MQFEKIRRINKSKVIIGGLIGLGVIGAMTILPSHAKYKLTESIKIGEGVVNYKVPDLKVMAMYQQNDSGEYDEITIMPESGYVINEEKTYCTTDNVNQVKGKIKTDNGKHYFSSLNKGDKCYLFFDKYVPTVKDTLAKLNITDIKTTIPSFKSGATTNVGVIVTDDPMYATTDNPNPKTYYFRGAVDNNYVKFANFCWRIIRINGDGSIRLIYDGTTCHANGTNTEESMVALSQVYNSSSSRSEYLGWTYSENMQRPLNDESETASNAKEVTDNWYNNNIGNNQKYNSKVVTGKFCNDREVQSGYTWSSTGAVFYYAARGRLETNKNPTFNCSNKNDIYELKAGAITADEAAFAGGVWSSSNSKYYLFNGQYYWTMSPLGGGGVLAVQWNGSIGAPYATSTAPGVRPVINLNADITFSSGDGTLDNPYEVI